MCVCQQSYMCKISTLKVLSLLKPNRPRGQNTPYEQQGGYKLAFVLGDPWLACFQWVDICLLCRDGQLSAYIGLLALPYMDLFSSSEWVCCKSIKVLANVMWKPNLTSVFAWWWWGGREQGRQAEMLPELFLQESVGGGSHRIERKASCSSSPGQLFRYVAGPQGQNARLLLGGGRLQRGANNTFHQYVTDVLKTACTQLAIVSWLIGPELFDLQVVTLFFSSFCFFTGNACHISAFCASRMQFSLLVSAKH